MRNNPEHIAQIPVSVNVKMEQKFALSPSKVERARKAIDFLSSLSDEAGPSGLSSLSSASKVEPREGGYVRATPERAHSSQEGKYAWCLYSRP